MQAMLMLKRSGAIIVAVGIAAIGTIFSSNMTYAAGAKRAPSVALCEGCTAFIEGTTGVSIADNGLTSSVRLAAGQYRLTWSAPVTSGVQTCVFLATLSSNTPGATPGSITTEQGTITKQTVVRTFNAAGAPADHDFFAFNKCGAQ